MAMIRTRWRPSATATWPVRTWSPSASRASSTTTATSAALADQAVVRLIEQDRIDILVDLAGHTGDNRLAVLARKPAPVQVSFLGYPDTTGMAQVDYRFTDRLGGPAGCPAVLHRAVGPLAVRVHLLSAPGLCTCGGTVASPERTDS